MSTSTAVLLEAPMTLKSQERAKSSTPATRAKRSGKSPNDVTISPDALQPYADSCFASTKNFFQCQASSVAGLIPVATHKHPITTSTPSQIGVHKVVSGWFVDCCDTDLVLNKCASHVGFQNNCEPSGDYYLNYIKDPDATSSAPASPSPSSTSLSSGAIAGVVVGSVAGAALLAILAAALLWRKRKAHQSEAEKAAMLAGINPPPYAADGAAGDKGKSSEVSVGELPATNEQHELPTGPLLSPVLAPVELPATTPLNPPDQSPPHPDHS